MPNAAKRPASVRLELEDLAALYKGESSTERYISTLEAERDAALTEAAEACRQMASMRGV